MMKGEQDIAPQSTPSSLSAEGCEPGLTALLNDLAGAAVEIDAGIAGAGLSGRLGGTGLLNIQGEQVQYLDALADRVFTSHLERGGNCAGIVSEERDEILAFEGESAERSRYVVLFDPLDGSSNIAVHLSIGTIFSIYRRQSGRGTPCTETDFLQPGNRQAAAGYILYGCATVLVYAYEGEVTGFTLDRTTGTFRLTHPHIRCPQRGTVYSVNQGYFHQYSQDIQQYISACGQPPGGKTGCSQRYAGSLVADIHRILLQGGVFLYPATRAKPGGKLRLLYECNPLSFLMEAAGGRATNGSQRVLDIQPDRLHQVTPVYMGSLVMMAALAEKLCADVRI